MTRASPKPPSLLARTRTLLQARGLRPRTARGQHFLVDPQVRDAIVAAAGVGPGDRVVEIGPGTGVLTEALLAKGASVFAVEVDRDLAAVLCQVLGGQPGLTLWTGDALAFDFGAHLGGDPSRGTIRVVANLPYYITTPVILRLVRQRELFQALYLTVQREVAERLTASPGGKTYGALTVACRYWATVRPLLDIPRTAFYPAPQVDSTLVGFDLLDTPRVQVASACRLFQVIRAAFGQRRKTLRNALCHAGWPGGAVDRALETSRISGRRRGETLTLEEFAGLSQGLPALATPDSDSDFRQG